MSNAADRRRTLQFLRHFAEATPGAPAELDEELRLYGLDPATVEHEALESIGRLRRRARLATAHVRFEAHQERLPALRDEARRRMDRAPNARERLVAMLREGAMGEVQFRNLEALPEEDLLDMLDEAHLLDFLNGLGDEAA